MLRWDFYAVVEYSWCETTLLIYYINPYYCTECFSLKFNLTEPLNSWSTKADISLKIPLKHEIMSSKIVGFHGKTAACPKNDFIFWHSVIGWCEQTHTILSVNPQKLCSPDSSLLLVFKISAKFIILLKIIILMAYLLMLSNSVFNFSMKVWFCFCIWYKKTNDFMWDSVENSKKKL